MSPDKAIYKGAIPGMLRTLDPHSNFFDPKDLEALREDQRGHYYGVGMSVQGRNGKTIVMAPFVGSPAYKAGLRPGDVIIMVNDKPTDNLDSTKVADLLKGPKGTPVQIKVAREGVDQPVVFNIIRDEISRKSVPDAFLLKPGIGYVFLEQFNETTSHEMEEALKAMDEDNLKGLVLDLRGNPGGLLNEAVAVGDHFLPKGDVIVSHKGRASAEHVYTARNGNHGRDYPIVVLVNRNSASAAEIVSGALQDHDRAWILGDNTFGKGLVQTVYPLVENTGLALTTAKYYTPSGRLIQRDYSNVSFFDYYYRNNTAARNLSDVKMHRQRPHRLRRRRHLARREVHAAQARCFRNRTAREVRALRITRSTSSPPQGQAADRLERRHRDDERLPRLPAGTEDRVHRSRLHEGLRLDPPPPAGRNLQDRLQRGREPQVRDQDRSGSGSRRSKRCRRRRLC